MHYLFKDVLGGQFSLFRKESNLNHIVRNSNKERTLSLAWNTGGAQEITIEGINYTFPSSAIVPLMANQLFQFSQPSSIILWMFNREFYCVFDHDKEVSCSGFLFYGMHHTLFIHLDQQEDIKLMHMNEFFIEEFGCADLLQGEMLRMLLKRLLIKLTRLAKKQYLTNARISDQEFNMIRSFNLLVETHYRKFHLVKQYAQILNISPKTLCHVFNAQSQYSPLEVIHNRIILEAKRMLCYTNKPTKEIAYDLGFIETSHFSRFFKNQTGLSPQFFKGNLKRLAEAN